MVNGSGCPMCSYRRPMAPMPCCCSQNGCICLQWDVIHGSGDALARQATGVDCGGGGLSAIGILWGDDLAGCNEQALGAAVSAAGAQLAEVAYVAFPWSRYQATMADGELNLAQQLEHQLEALLEKAVTSKARHVITAYGGADLDWAREQIGCCTTITIVFSCFLTREFQSPARQHWHPIAMPCADGTSLDASTPLPYRQLQQIWQAVEAGQPAEMPQNPLQLPGNPELWQQLFSGKAHGRTKSQRIAAKAAALIAEEHGNQRCVIQILRTLNSNTAEAFSLDANNLRLAVGVHPKASAQGRVNQIAYALSLKHSHRTPLAYRQIAELCPRLRLVERPSSIAITGSPGDNNRGSNSLCISEEPWWDLRSCGGRYKTGETGYLDGFFDDLPIPYYLAINPLILDRITLRLQRLAEIGEKGILEQLQRAKFQYLGIFEFRLGDGMVGALHPSLPQEWTVRPLSGLRTKIGILARAKGLGTNHGKGWGQKGFTGLRRRISVDWHLDKLHLIRQTSPMLGMAIENVHQTSYVSEKPFDMLCSGVVPITYASPNHALHRFLEPGSHLNVYGLKIGETLDAIQQFTPEPSVAESIHKTAIKLSKIFSSRAARDTTLERVADRCERWVLHQCRTRAYRADALP